MNTLRRLVESLRVGRTVALAGATCWLGSGAVSLYVGVPPLIGWPGWWAVTAAIAAGAGWVHWRWRVWTAAPPPAPPAGPLRAQGELRFPTVPGLPRAVLTGADGSVYRLFVVPGPDDPDGMPTWLAYGPAGQPVPPAGQVHVDLGELAPGQAVAVLLQIEEDDWGMPRFIPAPRPMSTPN